MPGGASIESVMANNPQLLVVDDDGLLAKSLTDMLIGRGYRVETARTGSDGLAMALQKRPALMILDYQLPGQDGLEVLRQLRDSEHGKDIEVIFATNTYDTAVINQALGMGVHDYILKSDTSLEQIAELVGKYVSPQP